MDENGAWAAGAAPDALLLEEFLAEPYFARPPPKSSGRDLFNERWLQGHGVARFDARVVQATLLELTASSVSVALRAHCAGARRLVVCGGGARNVRLMARLQARLGTIPVESSARHGIDPGQVEAAAFAWLAYRALAAQPGNLPAVTGARGPRVLGAVYPP